MKELSIEEKAKRYDEAIERARVWKEKSGMPADRQGILDDIFPELKVSEDEEVRKALYEYFKKLKDDGDIDETWYGFSYDKILAWLEKKGEQNLANSAKTCKDEKAIVIIPKFRIGDEIKTSNEESLIITKIDEKGYWSEDLFICDFDEDCLWDLVEQKPSWSEEDEMMLECILDKIGDLGTGEMCKDWLKSIKDRVQPKLKQEWSEEELYKIEHALFGTYAVDIATRLLNKIKSLNPQSQWKPSDEQIQALDEVYKTHGANNVCRHILLNLMNDLKKLRDK